MIAGCRRLCNWGCLALAALLPSCAGDAGPVPACHGGWHVLTGPADRGESNELFGVSAASAGDVWAVGVARRSGSPARTLVERWHGGKWRTIPSPDRPSGDSFLNAVVALSASDAWAVGLSRSPGGPARTLVLHWDGRRWAIIASPNSGPGDNSIESVAAASAQDAWAVGFRDAGNVYRSLVEHWDGHRWTVVRLPQLGGLGDGLNAVDAAASGVVWAVGGSSRPISAAGPSTRRTELVLCRRSGEPAQRHAERSRRLGPQRGMGCWRHKEQRWRSCLRPSDRWPKLARRPHRPRGRAERRPQRHLGGRT